MNKLKKSIKMSLIAILTTITALQIHNIHPVNATAPSDVIAGNIDYEGNYADDETHKNKTTNTSSKWYATYGKGTGYKGQGVLIYMLTKDGNAVSGVTPKAFICSSEVKNITLNAQDKYGKYDKVTAWEKDSIGRYEMIYWACICDGDNIGGKCSKCGDVKYDGRMMIDTTKVNTGAIKEWLLTEFENNNGEKSRNGIWLVQKLWGVKIAEQFVNKDIVLVVEPIVATQYAQRAAINNALTLRG